ncbi:intradiol ring-cleavage dioxygenase [Actinoplanes sp. NPDC048796]|uniref:dioxygenase family protein n=1 Tax=Actinoplanes sp. NPDC048796 TaxID=3155640 RepID=UPI0033DAF520
MTVQTQTRQHDGGLALDFPTLRRRRMLGLVTGVTVAALATPGGDALSRSGIVRSDLRWGFGTATGVAKGVPLTIRLRLTSATSGRPLSGHGVYLWHGDRDGAYSLYSPGLAGQNYLRGLQTTDGTGWVTFTSVFPGAYRDEWPHLHFEAELGVRGQISLPGDVCQQVYTTKGYEGSRDRLTGADPAGTNPHALAMACVTGDLERGFTATRTINI